MTVSLYSSYAVLPEDPSPAIPGPYCPQLTLSVGWEKERGDGKPRVDVALVPTGGRRRLEFISGTRGDYLALFAGNEKRVGWTFEFGRKKKQLAVDSFASV